jgi:hypothetical protein
VVFSLGRMTATESPDPDGRIPFRIKIGVTGHRDLDRTPELVAELRRQVARVRDMLSSPLTRVRLGVVSQLAEGADRLVVEEVFAETESRGEEARLEVVLPMPAEEYVLAQDFSPSSRADFERWLERATSTTELDLPGSWAELSNAYRAGGQHVVRRCDVLLALWSGEAGRRGGTAETLAWAAALGKPCIWIATGGEPGEIEDNLRDPRRFARDVEDRAKVPQKERPARRDIPENPLAPLGEALEALDAYNRVDLPHHRERWLETAPNSATFAWIDPSFRRASALAARYQRRFKWSARFITVFAAAAGILLAVSLSFGDSSVWVWSEFACLVLVLVGLVLVRRRRIHESWLSYRLLAERLRSARHLALTGINLRDTAELRGVFVERRSAEWLVRAFEEVWDRRPKAPALERPVEELRESLAEDWIGGQIRFHERAADHHKLWDRVLTWTILVLFVVTLAFTVVHAIGYGYLHEYTTFLSISLPAAVASLGALLTVSQHRALAERYSRMKAELKAVQQVVRQAEDATTLGQAGSEAARLIAEETGDWLGAMWFLDIEHPP